MTLLTVDNEERSPVWKDSSGSTGAQASMSADDNLMLENLIADGRIYLLVPTTSGAQVGVFIGEDADNDDRTELNVEGGSEGAVLRVGALRLLDSVDGNIVISNHYANGNMMLRAFNSSGVGPTLALRADPAETDRGQLDLSLMSKGSKFTLGGAVEIHAAGASGGETHLYVKGFIDTPGAISGWLPFVAHQVLPPFTASTNNGWIAAVVDDGYLASFDQSVYVVSPNDGSNYWKLELIDGQSTVWATVDTAAISAASWVRLSATPTTTQVIAATDQWFKVKLTKVGSPGNLIPTGPAVRYRPDNN